MKIILAALFVILSIALSACRAEDFYDSNSNFLDRQIFDSPDHTSYFDSQNVDARREREKPSKVYFDF